MTFNGSNLNKTQSTQSSTATKPNYWAFYARPICFSVEFEHAVTTKGLCHTHCASYVMVNLYIYYAWLTSICIFSRYIQIKPWFQRSLYISLLLNVCMWIYVINEHSGIGCGRRGRWFLIAPLGACYFNFFHLYRDPCMRMLGAHSLIQFPGERIKISWRSAEMRNCVDRKTMQLENMLGNRLRYTRRMVE